MPSICTNIILHLFGLVLFNSTHTENNGKGDIWEGTFILTQRKFNYKDLMKHEVKTKIIVEEENQPNLDKMANAIWKMLRK
jgi:hypothetical protein